LAKCRKSLSTRLWDSFWILYFCQNTCVSKWNICAMCKTNLICHKIKFRAHLARTSGAAQPKDLCKWPSHSNKINFWLLASRGCGLCIMAKKPGQINQFAITWKMLKNATRSFDILESDKCERKCLQIYV